MRVLFHQAIDDMDKALGKTIRQSNVYHQKRNYELVKSVIDANRSDVEAAIAAG